MVGCGDRLAEIWLQEEDPQGSKRNRSEKKTPTVAAKSIYPSPTELVISTHFLSSYLQTAMKKATVVSFMPVPCCGYLKQGWELTGVVHW